MVVYLITGVGTIYSFVGILGLLNPTKLQSTIRNWFTNKTGHLQLLGILTFLYGALMLLVALPAQSTSDIIAAVLGCLLVSKGAAALIMPQYEGFRNTYLRLLDIYTRRPVWNAQCVVALLLGIVLVIWGTAQIVRW